MCRTEGRIEDTPWWSQRLEPLQASGWEPRRPWPSARWLQASNRLSCPQADTSPPESACWMKPRSSSTSLWVLRWLSACLTCCGTNTNVRMCLVGRFWRYVWDCLERCSLKLITCIWFLFMSSTWALVGMECVVHVLAVMGWTSKKYVFQGLRFEIWELFLVRDHEHLDIYNLILNSVITILLCRV